MVNEKKNEKLSVFLCLWSEKKHILKYAGGLVFDWSHRSLKPGKENLVKKKQLTVVDFSQPRFFRWFP